MSVFLHMGQVLTGRVWALLCVCVSIPLLARLPDACISSSRNQFLSPNGAAETVLSLWDLRWSKLRASCLIIYDIWRLPGCRLL